MASKNRTFFMCCYDNDTSCTPLVAINMKWMFDAWGIEQQSDLPLEVIVKPYEDHFLFFFQRLLSVLYSCLEFPDYSGEQTRKYALQALAAIISNAWPRSVQLDHNTFPPFQAVSHVSYPTQSREQGSPPIMEPLFKGSHFYPTT